jgi:hypothetical protein
MRFTFASSPLGGDRMLNKLKNPRMRELVKGFIEDQAAEGQQSDLVTQMFQIDISANDFLVREQINAYYVYSRCYRHSACIYRVPTIYIWIIYDGSTHFQRSLMGSIDAAA